MSQTQHGAIVASGVRFRTLVPRVLLFSGGALLTLIGIWAIWRIGGVWGGAWGALLAAGMGAILWAWRGRWRAEPAGLPLGAIRDALQTAEHELAWRNRIAEVFLTEPEETLYGAVLDVVLEVSESEHGGFGFLDEEGSIVFETISVALRKQCQEDGASRRFAPSGWAGLWGQVLRERRPLFSNGPLHLPEGHVPLRNALAVPILHRDALIGQLMVANKQGHYDEVDLSRLEGIAEYIAPILHARLERDRHAHRRALAEQQLRRQAHDLQERVKELRCLQNVSRLFEGFYVDTVDIGSALVPLIPPAYQYPEVTVARMVLGEQVHATEGFRETAWKQTVPICAEGETLGRLEVCYLEERPTHDEGPFLAEERELLEMIAERVGKVIVRQRIGQELVEARRQAEAANYAKSQFLANMSHEIRTPMTAILGFTEILLESLQDPAEIRAANTIQHNGEHLLRILNDILDLSRIESGKMMVEPEACSPQETVQEVLSLMSLRAEQKGLVLSCSTEGEIPERVWTDPTRLRQILLNLVGNSIKFTSQGSVRIVLRSVPAGLCGNDLELEVRDTGIGMTAEQTARLFEPFYQADGSARRAFGGTGLGLAISHRLARMLGGSLSVTSQVQVGSCFRLRIAAAPVSETEPAATASIEVATPSVSALDPSVLAGRRILLVEDGPDNQRLVTHLLEKVGAVVELVGNGSEAVTLIVSRSSSPGGHEPFDLILMDMQMPVMDGYEATQVLRQRGYRGPIVALTASAMSSDRSRCLAAGCTAYVAKPFRPTELYRVACEQLAAARETCPADVG